MRKSIVFLVVVFGVIFTSCSNDFVQKVTSPSNTIILNFEVKNGVPSYSVNRLDKKVLLDSKLGFAFKNMPSLDSDFQVGETKITSFDDTWEQPWGEKQFVRNNYTQLEISLVEKHDLKRTLNIIFKVYDDGIGFRYIIPKQENIDTLEISDEITEFNLAGNDSVWWYGSYQPAIDEYLYTKTSVSKMDTAYTPVTIEALNGLYLSIHEANLTDYAGMTLYPKSGNTLKIDLVPWADGTKVYSKSPMQTPWRYIQIAEKPGDLITSYMMLNLNDPCAIDDVSWIKPMKYIGIWWAYHIDKYTWDQGPRHGATTKNMKEYIDFAAENGFDGVLAEGWNFGWNSHSPNDSSTFSYITPYPDFDIVEITNYAASKNISIIGHHETFGNTLKYESQMDSAYRFYNKYNINSIKLGYVGHKMDHTQWHHSQYGVRHYRKAVELAAKYHLMLDVHESIVPTGLCRTYPNLLAAESQRGQEFNAWSRDGGNPPEHETILPFTRILAGPMDFTPGIFDITIPERPNNQVNTTLAKQLALYVVIYSPFQMAADLPEHYLGVPAFDFIKNVPVDWSETRVLNAKIGDYITTVRKDKHSSDWYLGSITDEHAREYEIPLTFLEPGKKYRAKIYADGTGADYKTNPLSITIEEKIVDSSVVLPIKLAPGGGLAVSFKLIE